MTCYGSTVVSGVLESTDADQELLLLTQLQTPMGELPASSASTWRPTLLHVPGLCYWHTLFARRLKRSK